jgi:polyphosphate kinase 2 (PPK2 family)
MPRRKHAEPRQPPCLAAVDLARRLDTEDYERRLLQGQRRLREIQLAYFQSRRRALIVIEGWDAAGKGGIIRRMAILLDPRGFRVWPIAAPESEEQGRHYLYRFWRRVPERGVIAVFDRSWYGRVLVERVEGLVDRAAWMRAYREINEFERMLTDDGARIVKVFLHMSPEEQLRRFEERIRNPLKRWKITLDDLRARQKRSAYALAIDEMFAKTSMPFAPWHIVSAEDKFFARIEVLNLIARRLADGVDLRLPPLDPAVVREARRVLGLRLPKQSLKARRMKPA